MLEQEIEKAFELTESSCESRGDFLSAIHGLSCVQESERPALFGELLCDLLRAIQKQYQPIGDLLELQDRLTLAHRFAQDPKSLMSIEKIIGRDF